MTHPANPNTDNIPIIQVSNLVKRFGLKTVLRGVDFQVQAGEFEALLGPNGAGKTTFLRILSTLSRPAMGRVRIAGYPLPAQAAAVRRILGVVSHQPLLYGDLTAEENLLFYGRMYGVADLKARVDEVLQMVGLSGRRRDLVRTFSRGMQQRLAIGRAVIHDPQVLLLDEPYTGLDKTAADLLDQIMVEAKQEGRSILFSTHDLERGLAIADRAVVMKAGRLIYDLPHAEWRNLAGFMEIYARVLSDNAPRDARGAAETIAPGDRR